MDLTMNHIQENMDIFINLDKADLHKKILICSFVFPNSYFNILNNIKSGDIIHKINDKDVSCINDFKKAIKTPIVINNNNLFLSNTFDYCLYWLFCILLNNQYLKGSHYFYYYGGCHFYIIVVLDNLLSYFCSSKHGHNLRLLIFDLLWF